MSSPAHLITLVPLFQNTSKTRRFAHLDLFNTPSHWLPEATGDGDPLPIFWVAPLEAGGLARVCVFLCV